MKTTLELYNKTMELNSIYDRCKKLLNRIEKDETVKSTEQYHLNVLRTALKGRCYSSSILTNPMNCTMVEDGYYETTSTWDIARVDLIELMEMVGELTSFIDKLSERMEYRESGIFTHSSRKSNTKDLRNVVTCIHVIRDICDNKLPEESDDGKITRMFKKVFQIMN